MVNQSLHCNTFSLSQGCRFLLNKVLLLVVFPYVKSSLQATSELNKLKFESSQWSGLNIMNLETAEYNSEEGKGGMPR